MSTLFGTMGAISEYNQQRANAQMQEDQALYNQRLAQREADALADETSVNVQLQQLESRRLMTAQRAALGASGAALDSGSPLAVAGVTAALENFKANNVLRQGYMQRSKLLEQGKMYGYQAGVARASKPGAVQGIASIGGALIGGASGDMSLIAGGKKLWG